MENSAAFPALSTSPICKTGNWERQPQTPARIHLCLRNRQFFMPRTAHPDGAHLASFNIYLAVEAIHDPAIEHTISALLEQQWQNSHPLVHYWHCSTKTRTTNSTSPLPCRNFGHSISTSHSLDTYVRYNA